MPPTCRSHSRSDWRRWRRCPTARSSSPRVAAIRLTPRPSSRAATGTRSDDRQDGHGRAVQGLSRHARGRYVAGGHPGQRRGLWRAGGRRRTINWDDAKSLLGLIEAYRRTGSPPSSASRSSVRAGSICRRTATWEVRGICRDHDILFVADEVVTGFGRIGGGAWFASSRFGPGAGHGHHGQGLTSGYLPMGAVLIAPHLADRSSPAVCGGATATPMAATPVPPPRRWRTWTSSSGRT